MRILTIGVLIVSGGTLAALPFRRYQAIPDARVAPARATGPTQSALTSEKPESKTEAPPAQVDPVLSIADHLPKWEPPREPVRQINMPLTYDDLAIPVDQPGPIKHRFNATASVQREAIRREQAAVVRPTMESIAIQQPAGSESLVSIRATQDPTQLASTTLEEAAAETLLPPEPPAPRERHWIRQPVGRPH